VQPGRHLDDRLQAAVFPAQLRELVGVAERGRVGQQSFDFAGARERGR